MANNEKAEKNASLNPGDGVTTPNHDARKDDSRAEDPKKEAQGGLHSYLRVFTYADHLSWILNVIAFLAAIGAGAVLPLMDLIFGKFVTTFVRFSTGVLTPAQYRSEVNKYTLYFLYLFVAKFCLFYTHSVLISIAAIRTTKALRVDFVRATLRQNVAYFDSAESGSVTSQVTTSTSNVNNGISEKLTLTIQGLSTFVTAFIIAFAVQWKLTLITISIIPTIIVAVGVCLGFMTKWENEMLEIYGQAGKLAEEVFSTMQTVHAFWLNPLLARKFDQHLLDARVIGMKNSPVYAVLFSTEFFCIYSAYGLAFWRGIRMYVSGEISQPGQVFTVILAVIVAATAMSTIAPQIIALGKGASAAAQLFQVIDRVSEIDSLSEEGLIPEKCAGRVEIQGISFAYPTRPDVQVLQMFSLSVPANSTTALVGASGSGKSTIVGLMERWYDPSAGNIFLDGTRIQDLNLRWLRTNIRLVQQEPVLFSGTVFENVACGLFGTEKGSLPEDQQRKLVVEACKSAYADEFVAQLPQGYDTQIGERAMMLSGGQKQRLAIARSIISDPQVLLLDEATSALDPKAEKMVQQALDSVSKNRTTIVIAHKLSTIKNADNIAVMAKGSIIEQGTHNELLDKKGAYASLVTAQDLGKADGAEETLRHSADDDGEKPTLVRTQTQASMHSQAAVKTGKDGINYNLISCIFIVFWEHRRLWPYFLILIFASLMGGATYPAQAVLFARIATTFEIPGAEAVERGDFYSLMFFVVAIGNLIAYSLIGWFSNVVVQHVSRGYRLEIFNLILKQDMNFFDREENATGALVSNLSTYPTSLLELLGFNVMLIFINVISVLSSCILALVVGWKLGCAVAFGALPLVVFSGYLRIRLEFKLEEQTGKRFASSAALASEAVSAIRTVSSLALERHIIARYAERLQGVARHSMKSLFWTMFWYSFTQSVSFLAMALGFWYGGQLISRGEYNTTQFYTVFIAVIFSGEAAASFFSYTTSMTKAATAANYIFWLRRQTPRVQENPSKPPFNDGNEKDPAHIQVDNVDFAYESRPNANVLKNIDVDVKPGQFVAFVGASGCGKSTAIALFERFYDPTSGCITCDGSTLLDLCPRKYRSHVSLVQQEPVLYQGSIRDNIAMGVDNEVTEAQIEDAAKQANIYTFVASLPNGFNTMCGSRGTQLSGGQRQRIAIARALIRQPRLLLLDEATSALDTESEKIVQAALEKVKDGRTTIAVAHRLSTIKDADVIVVFSKGRVAEVGTHKELLGRRGMYYEMSLGQSLDRSIPA
ncbi:P-loop containing nucleoside triphosphate hydrolase protein [Paraphaeosphaeria sporulosa]|uniref:p-loop containing nucleoside triphosphate hydrolase protein n=1 Tax=Paraphaeosphaeria sporulosa TaxID=1460663 RepID=A0A177C278_9PLEO|nr:P-loop containing nucleoside triphosphate hydrolase protein [Paraphaeosphaeria sporulosa]OAG00999.1 P-loop containing nucleoside triphosphate hydrolase protein [Paraphaeosphaeria sporulosa]